MDRATAILHFSAWRTMAGQKGQRAASRLAADCIFSSRVHALRAKPYRANSLVRTGKNMQTRHFRRFVRLGACLLLAAIPVAAQSAPDPGKKACAKEARALCPAEMQSLSRKKVEACMIAKIARTSPICHAAMLRIKAEREATAKR